MYKNFLLDKKKLVVDKVRMLAKWHIGEVYGHIFGKSFFV
jgi:hypothetical protein